MSENSAMTDQEKTEKYICHVYYERGNGHACHRICARSPKEAFDKLLVEIKDDVDAEEESQPRLLDEQVNGIAIEVVLPLNPGQHPDTPPLCRGVAYWKPVRKIVTEWVEELADDEGEKASKVSTAQAFAQCMAPPGMKAVVTSVTEFGVTGTIVPSWNE